MSSNPATLADKAKKAMDQSKYDEAVELYTQAIKLSPEAPDYYIKRSIAHQRTSQYQLALDDADKGVFLGKKRGKRDIIGTAQLRRGISLQTLGRLGDSKFCLELAKKYNDKEKTIDVWLKKVEGELAKATDESKKEVTVKEIPEVEIEKPKPVVVAPPPPPPEGVQTPASKIRHEFYDTTSHVVFTLYVKGVPKDKAVVSITATTVSISFPMPNGSTFSYELDPLYEEIDSLDSKYDILSTKIEIKLKKKRPGLKWKAIEGSHSAPTPAAAPVVAESKSEPKVESAPAYPTSSKHGPKNWDKLASELAKKEKKKDEKVTVDSIDDELDDEEGDPVNNLFKKIYAGADEDTKRAMMKSYIESNGTALSTNWKDVSKGKVETSPPEGMEAKGWN